MQRIQTSNSRFISGNPQLGTPGTIVTAKFLNDIQEEISNVITDAGFDLDGAKENQLSTAIKKLISENFWAEGDLLLAKRLRQHDKSIHVVSPFKRVLFIGDSLTELRSGTSYVRDIAPKIASMIGDYGEIGYVPFSSYQTKNLSDMGIQLSRSANMINMWGVSDGSWDQLPYTYSPDGKGMHIDNGNSDYISINFTKQISFNKVRLFYLQQAGGGTFKFGFKNQSSKILINTDGDLALKHIDIDSFNGVYSYDTRITDITGKVALFGLHFIGAHKDGFTYNVFSRQGALLKDFKKLQVIPQYIQSLEPDTVFINIGTNDANQGFSANEFGNDLITFINMLKTALPNIIVLLIEPNRPAYYDYANADLKGYTQKRQEISLQMGCGYIDVPARIGDYTEIANEMEDTTHPSGEGKKLIANTIFDYVLANQATNSLDNSLNSNLTIPRISLNQVQKNYLDIQANTKTLVARYGLLGSFNTADFDVTLRIGTYGGSIIERIKFLALRSNTEAETKVTSLSVIETETIKNNSYTGVIFEVQLIDGFIEISFTSPQRVSFYSLFGYVYSNIIGDSVVQLDI